MIDHGKNYESRIIEFVKKIPIEKWEVVPDYRPYYLCNYKGFIIQLIRSSGLWKGYLIVDGHDVHSFFKEDHKTIQELELSVDKHIKLTESIIRLEKLSEVCKKIDGL